MECHLALAGAEPAVPAGNLLLDYLLGAGIHWCGAQRKGEQLPAIAAGLAAAGRRPYIIPYGGSNAIGALGFAAAALEVKKQLAALKIIPDYLVLASSSGGTQAGLVAGLSLCELPVPVIGIAIDNQAADEPAYETRLAELANQTVVKLQAAPCHRAADFQVNYDYLGKGYGVLGKPEQEAIGLVARLEGLILDPVYTGRAMSGLIDLIRRQRFRSTDTVLFWHTGGAPALFTYARELADLQQEPGS